MKKIGLLLLPLFAAVYFNSCSVAYMVSSSASDTKKLNTII
jgi:hypothetical protein